MSASTGSEPSSRHFIRHDNRLRCEGVDFDTIAAQVGTPAFVYSASAIDDAFATVDRALGSMPHLIAYAVKANSNLAVLARLGRAGSGADIVSGGELARCQQAGIPPERIVFSGVGKRDEEIEAALQSGIRSIHVESAGELTAIEEIARRLQMVAPIALRVNPDVDAQTHPYIATGLHDTKFGLELDAARALLPRILGSPELRLHGVACHIGSQITKADAVRDAVAITGRFAQQCIRAGAPIRALDAGGGWPIAYQDEVLPPVEAFVHAIQAGLEQAGLQKEGQPTLEVVVEPGRILVGQAGVLLTRVLFVKDQVTKRFVIVDASMTEFIRPALYQAHHEVVPVGAIDPDGSRSRCDVVGPVCESGDFLARDRELPPVQRGDLLTVWNAGAYGMVMASQYNSRPRPAEVLVEGDRFRAIRERESIADLWRGEHV